MKFTYDKREDREECVAFIHSSGSLVIKLENPTKEGYCHIVGSSRGAVNEAWWRYWMESVKKKFYPGDKVTIEF